MMAEKNYKLTFEMSDGTERCVQFTVPKGDKGDSGVSGVYVGSGEMPEGYNVQIDPSGEIDTLPTKLPNPHILKFTGAVQAEYDGSSPTTVNIPSGGSGGVSSWNELTDKPFYTEMGNGVILPETAAMFVEDQGVFAIADPVALVIGEEYSVSWNGVPYSCVALPYEEEGVLMGAMLGNVGAMTGESMTEEPFLVICVTPEMMEVTGSPVGIMIMPLDGSESVTLSISGLMEIVHPIDKKYLPKAAIPANGKVVFTRDDAGNCTCDKTYEEIGMMFASGIFPWAQLNGVANDGCPLFLKDFQVASIGIQFNTTAFFQLANNGLSGVYHVFINIAESGEISCSVSRLDASTVTL